ncbi:GntR family transcriptional regulator [Oricola indica]|jgi:GntR family transcriptional regulator|uniref:GntR family transcriptional regulator n=1 Tax=Oricola indica TaxID=2872591 RepID=UPI001CBC1804|nr:GntR family transcriptional regulator [Oricola indica]
MVSAASIIDRFPRNKLSREDGPLYQQLADLIRGMIVRGDIEVGTDLPKEAEIEAHLGVSLITVRRALRELEDLGLIQKRSAKPAKVTAKSPTVRAGTRYESLEDLVASTSGTVLVINSYALEKSPLAEAHFGLAPGEAGWCLRGHLSKDGQIKTLITTFFPPDIGEKMKVSDFTDKLVFRNLQRCLSIRIERVLVTARAEVASKAQARELGVAAGSPLMSTEMVYLTDKQRAVEVTITAAPSEHFVLSYDIPLEES